MKIRKVLPLLLLALVMSVLVMQPRANAAGGNVTVASSAGGTLVMPAGNGFTAWLVNTGTTNAAYCLIGATSTNVVTATNYNFQLAAGGGTWLAPSITYAPNQIGQPRIAGSEGVTCLSAASTTTVTWYRR